MAHFASGRDHIGQHDSWTAGGDLSPAGADAHWHQRISPLPNRDAAQKAQGNINTVPTTQFLWHPNLEDL